MAITIYLSLFFLIAYLVGLAIHRTLFLRDKRRMQQESRAGARIVARVAEVEPGGVKKFWIICQKYRVAGLLVNDGGTLSCLRKSLSTYADTVGFYPRSVCQRGWAISDVLHARGALRARNRTLYLWPVQGRVALSVAGLRRPAATSLVGCPEGNISHLAD